MGEPTRIEAPIPVSDGSAHDRPENVPEKFWDAAAGTVNTDALLASYGELEGKLGAGEAPAAPAPQEGLGLPAAPAAPATPETPEGGAAQLASLGPDAMARYANEYRAGGLTDESYTELAKDGLSRELVDGWIAGQAAQRDQRDTALMNEVGGQAKYQEMAVWAAANMNAAEKEAYEAAVNGGDDAAARMAIQGLQARFNAGNSQPPTTRVEGAPNAVGGDVFPSFQSWIEAMAAPEYHTSDSYRRTVDERYARSVNIH